MCWTIHIFSTSKGIEALRSSLGPDLDLWVPPSPEWTDPPRYTDEAVIVEKDFAWGCSCPAYHDPRKPELLEDIRYQEEQTAREQMAGRGMPPDEIDRQMQEEQKARKWAPFLGLRPDVRDAVFGVAESGAPCRISVHWSPLDPKLDAPVEWSNPARLEVTRFRKDDNAIQPSGFYELADSQGLQA